MHAMQRATDITFVCLECKIGDPSPHVSFDVADVSFDHTGGIQVETLEVSDDDHIDSDVPDDIADMTYTVVPSGSTRGKDNLVGSDGFCYTGKRKYVQLHNCLSVCLNGYIPAIKFL